VSVNAGCERDYSTVHGVDKGEWERVIENVARAGEYRNKVDSKCKIGIQCVVYEDNWERAHRLVGVQRKVGADYVVFKPLSVHPSQLNSCTPIKGSLLTRFIVTMREYDGDRRVVVRDNAFRGGKNSKCYAVPFLWAYIAARGDVWACSAMMGDERFLVGNIHDTGSFSDVWNGEKRSQLASSLVDYNTSKCRENCRMRECNEYLEMVDHGCEHREWI
jgi:radical SAM protein with 4Fe4S-binding SPASM domain